MKTLMTATIAAMIGIGSQIQLEPGSKVWVDGGSTVRDWTCQTEDFASSLKKTDGSEIATLIEGAVVTIPVGKLECGNGTMNEHMRKALKTKQHPNIEFRMTSYTIQGEKALLRGTLQIAGTTKPVEMTGRAQAEGDVVRVSGSKQLTMSEWGVKPPTLMLGTMKVRDDVTVGFDVTLKR